MPSHRGQHAKKQNHQIACLTRTITLLASGNKADAAIAELVSGINFDRSALGRIGVLAGLSANDPILGLNVRKVGRSSGHTVGRVTAIEVDGVTVGYDRGNLVFDGQIEIQGLRQRVFSKPGDSGSLIVDSYNFAVGLLFAGSEASNVTFANDIREVLDLLDIDLLW